MSYFDEEALLGRGFSGTVADLRNYIRELTITIPDLSSDKALCCALVCHFISIAKHRQTSTDFYAALADRFGIKTPIPLVLSPPNLRAKKRVVVFPNLSTGNTAFMGTGSYTITASPFIWESRITSLVREHTSFEDHIARLKTYEDRADRFLIWLLTSREVSIETAIAMVVNSTLAAHTLTELANQMVNTTVDTTLIVSNDFDKYVEGVEGGVRSCMTSRSGTGEGGWGKVWGACGKTPDTHPVAWYHYHPDVQIAYLKRGTSVIARTFLYGVADNPTGYGRIYSGTSADNNALRTQLLEKFPKIRELPERWHTLKPFSVPIREATNKKFYVPMPYCDNLDQRYMIGHDKKNNAMVFAPVSLKAKLPGYTQVGTAGTSGYINCGPLMSVGGCVVCDAPIKADGTYSEHGGDLYCSPTCLRVKGLVRAESSTGDIQVLPAAETVPDMYVSDVFYTNIEAATRRGALLVFATPYDILTYPKTKPVGVSTITPLPIFYNGGAFTLPSSALHEILHEDKYAECLTFDLSSLHYTFTPQTSSEAST